MTAMSRFFAISGYASRNLSGNGVEPVGSDTLPARRPAAWDTALRDNHPCRRRPVYESDQNAGIPIWPLWLPPDRIAGSRCWMECWHGPRATHLAPRGAEDSQETQAKRPSFTRLQNQDPSTHDQTVSGHPSPRPCAARRARDWRGKPRNPPAHSADRGRRLWPKVPFAAHQVQRTRSNTAFAAPFPNDNERIILAARPGDSWRCAEAAHAYN
jgi:hypothetical protein